MRVRDAVDASKVTCSGPGLGPSVRARLPQSFTVDVSAAGHAALEVTLLGPTGTWGHGGVLCLGGCPDLWGVLLHKMFYSLDPIESL